MSDALLDVQPDQPVAPKGALLAIFLIVFMDLLGFGIIIPLLPRYIPNYQGNPLEVTLLFSIYSICQFIGAPILGVISDRHGRRPVLVLSQLGSAVGYVILGIATNFNWGSVVITLWLVYASRIIDGFTGGNISTAQAYISDVTTPANRAKGMGLLGAAFGIGFSAGPALGGILGHFAISLPAYVAAFFSALAALVTFLKLPESRVHKPTEAEVWLHPSRFRPIFQKPVLVQLLLISFTIMAAFVMMEAVMVLFLDRIFGFKELGTGAYFGFLRLIIIIVQGGLIGRLTKKFGDWPLAILGPVLVAVGMGGLVISYFLPFTSILLLAGAINAAGRSFMQPTISSLISKHADRNDQGTVFGLFHGLGSIARVVGPLIAGFTYKLHLAAPFGVAGIISLAVALWAIAVRATAPDPVAPVAVLADPPAADAL